MEMKKIFRKINFSTLSAKLIFFWDLPLLYTALKKHERNESIARGGPSHIQQRGLRGVQQRNGSSLYRHHSSKDPAIS
jgi:hypothetical protein